MEMIPSMFPQSRSKVSAQVLSPEHYEVLCRALRNVLSTDLAELTMAQLVDGLPLASSAFDARGSLIFRGHPIIDHETLCEGALEQTRVFRDSFDINILTFDSLVLQAYQDSEPVSKQFNMRLIELVAAAIHQIAVLLFDLKPKLHIGDVESVTKWEKEPEVYAEGRRVLEVPYFEPKPTLFFHTNYMDYDQYPDGLADVAGYWAEDRIFGGIVVFDRGDSGTECRDLYFHSGRQQTMFRVWRLLDEQFDGLVDFLTSGTHSTRSPFPILATDENLHRYDPWDAIARHHVFRNPWERKFPPVKPEETRDVRSTGDYPELKSMFTELEAAYLPRTDMEGTFDLPDNIFTGRRQDTDHSDPAVSTATDADNDSLFVRTPPRSPVMSLSGDGADASSLHVRTPPRSPILPVQGDETELGRDIGPLSKEDVNTERCSPSPPAAEPADIKGDLEGKKGKRSSSDASTGSRS